MTDVCLNCGINTTTKYYSVVPRCNRRYCSKKCEKTCEEKYKKCVEWTKKQEMKNSK